MMKDGEILWTPVEILAMFSRTRHAWPAVFSISSSQLQKTLHIPYQKFNEQQQLNMLIIYGLAMKSCLFFQSIIYIFVIAR